MWCHCRLNHLPLRTVCQALLEKKNRCLHTHSVCLSPRGYTRSEREQVSTQTDATPVQNVSAAEPGKTQGVTRSIDTMDPIVLKYTNMVNEMRSPVVREKINITNFGSIRFDHENIPTVHGQFDEEQELETQERDGVKDIIPEVLIDSTRVSIEENSYDTDESINDFYFLNDSDSSHVRGMNYIDEQVFQEAYSKYQSSGSLDSKEANPPIKSKSRVQLIPKSETSNQDLNFIDNYYFGSSLEALSENRKSSLQFSDIKSEIEASLTCSKTKKVSEHEVAKVNETVHSSPLSVDLDAKEETVAGRAKKIQEENEPVAESVSTSAFDYIVQKRREEHNKKHDIKSGDGSKKSYKKVLSLLNAQKKEETTKYEMLKVLKNSIIYDNYDVIGLYKPYSVVMHPGTESAYHTLTDFLPDLATFLKAENLYPIHRLDATTTGVLLLARTPAMANTLKGMLKDRQLKKIYWAITKGIPKPPLGVIDIPIAEGLIDGRRRMVLKPDIKGLKSTSRESHLAVTSYKVLSGCFNTALVECHPMTGVKHQLRVHLGFGLACPVLGDHKYSHLRKLAPQRLPGDTLDHLGLKQSQVRKLPLFLHSRSIVIPELADGRDVTIRAKLPAFFNKTLTLLHLNRKQSQIKHQSLSIMEQS